MLIDYLIPPGKHLLNLKQCQKCRLYQSNSCTQIVNGYGNTNADIVFFAEAPGQTEDKYGIPFVGVSGKYLRKMIKEHLNISDGDVFMTNTLRCHPPMNRNPLPEELDACANYWKEEILAIKPKIIVTAGNFSSKALIGSAFKRITADRRKVFSNDICQIIIPIVHPASIRGTDTELIQKTNDFELDFAFIKKAYDHVRHMKKTDNKMHLEKSFDSIKTEGDDLHDFI